MKQTKKMKSAKEIERSLELQINQEGEFDSIKADGQLDEAFILTYLIRNNQEAAQDYWKIIKAFNKIKQRDIFIKGMHSRKVSKETLKKIILNNEAIVRPLKSENAIRHSRVYFGEILKLPAINSDCVDGDEWKALVKKETDFDVGDKVIYNYKYDIILDNELLHIVGCFAGKLLE